MGIFKALGDALAPGPRGVFEREKTVTLTNEETGETYEVDIKDIQKVDDKKHR